MSATPKGRCDECKHDPGWPGFCEVTQRRAGGHYLRTCPAYTPTLRAADLRKRLEEAGLDGVVAELQDLGPRHRGLRLTKHATDAERWAVYQALGKARALEPIKIKPPRSDRLARRRREAAERSGSGAA